MAGSSNIEWTDATWNPIVGCSIVSPGCTNCYAMRMAARIEKMTLRSHYDGTTQPSKAGPVWTGKIARAQEDILLAPLRWKKPRCIFVNSMGDLFHESIPDEWIDRVFAVMVFCPQHTFQVLTKRASRMRDYMRSVTLSRIDAAARSLKIKYCAPWLFPFPNVWLGVSAERQEEAGERLPLLLYTPAAIRFVSVEPLLGPVDLTNLRFDALHGVNDRKIDWVIVGGESGPHARPMHPNWARSIRDQCQNAGVAFFFKQWGQFVPMIAPLWPESAGSVNYYHPTMKSVGKKAAGRLLDGVEHNAFPVIEGVDRKRATTSPDPNHPVAS
jgi:protein gp37